jgi:indolepyruvate ferredoxin oxidoreductase
MEVLQVSLDDRYRLDAAPFYLNGTQSLVRLVMLEQRRRAAEGRKTAIYVSGYRGSPLGTLDQALTAARRRLGEHVVFRPGVNEDLAATAIWGTQQVGVFASGPYEGVSGLWYGKGPGVDRTGDVFKHANLAGSAAQGGVLVVAGDDHTCKSSTTAHQSEFGLIDAMMPVLAPSSVAEQIEFGLVGWALSRFSGLWVGMKVVTEIMDSNVSLAADPVVSLAEPDDFVAPAGGLSLRWPDSPLAQEERLHCFKIPAALAYARVNRLDRVSLDAPNARLGIVTVGKAHADTRQALRDLGVDEARARTLGIRLYKVAMPWPLERSGVLKFAEGLDEIIVVEEKRALVEDQLRQILYGAANAPRIVGKFDEAGGWLFASNGDLGPDVIATALGRRLGSRFGDADAAARAEAIAARRAAMARSARLAERPPHFCSGCPHNRSTQVPEGSKAFAGIGCHYLVLPMERRTEGFTHMGGEGANWTGLAPFASTAHVFQNIGDGTYFHSGSLAIRAAVAAGVNITYKVLFNGAVAMTGGQPMDGALTPGIIARQMLAEGASRVVIVSDAPSRLGRSDAIEGVSIHDRADLDAVQRQLRDVPGVTGLIFDQTCATELRRMRKRGQAPDPNVTVMINDLVCEGCGDCSIKSNCLAVTPVETEFGRKRAIDQSACNKDRSCVDGFCPSFVSVSGAGLRKSKARLAGRSALPEPELAALESPASILVAGVGGTGVVTIGALLGMAAHMEGKAVRVMDMTGLAQKGGAVVSHIQIASPGVELLSAQLALGSARLLIGCDAVVAAAPENRARLSSSQGHVVANRHESITGQFTREADLALPIAALCRQLTEAAGGRADFIDATDLANRLVGDAVGANLLLVGYAWQKGLVPVSRAALEAAIELNGVAVGLNKSAFEWGRRAAVDLAGVREAASGGPTAARQRLSETLEETIARRVAFLADYQDDRYAARYQRQVANIEALERAAVGGELTLTETVARTLFRLMAYKDEYEVARLHAESGFIDRLRDDFDGPIRLTFHMAPPALARRDPATGEPRKMRFGGWVLPMLALLAKGRRLRGTPFDPFGYSAERRTERALIEGYVRMLDNDLAPRLSAANHAEAVALAGAAGAIRGYGHVKARSIAAATQRQAELHKAYLRAGGADQFKPV